MHVVNAWRVSAHNTFRQRKAAVVVVGCIMGVSRRFSLKKGSVLLSINVCIIKLLLGMCLHFFSKNSKSSFFFFFLIIYLVSISSFLLSLLLGLQKSLYNEPGVACMILRASTTSLLLLAAPFLAFDCFQVDAESPNTAQSESNDTFSCLYHGLAFPNSSGGSGSSRGSGSSSGSGSGSCSGSGSGSGSGCSSGSGIGVTVVVVLVIVVVRVVVVAVVVVILVSDTVTLPDPYALTLL